MGRGACLAVSSRPLGQRQRRPDGRTCSCCSGERQLDGSWRIVVDCKRQHSRPGCSSHRGTGEGKGPYRPPLLSAVPVICMFHTHILHFSVHVCVLLFCPLPGRIPLLDIFREGGMVPCLACPTSFLGVHPCWHRSFRRE